jgi:glycosyltransferase involved in cell wall biosynthesis
MTRKRLCLNMIVKNEVTNLDRCLEAIADHIDGWVICDTGSTDGTQEAIRAFFAKRGIPGELCSAPFITWEQARNAALDFAEASALDFDYILFCDADMQLVVEDKDFRDRLETSGYRLLQRTVGGLAYFNTRIVKRGIGVRYRGVTHEYVDVPGGTEELRSVWYLDHASGSNRVDKFERDIRLLLGGLEAEPNNHRYWYYLAQSYRDANQTAKAAEVYGVRAEMPNGWEEEAWHARLQQSRCLLKLGDEAGFVQQALAAFSRRPWRVEPVYDLAKYYRVKGQFETSAIFAEAGLSLDGPGGDILFIEDYAYKHGLLEEYSIAANYASDPERKDRGFQACDRFALSREVGEGQRNLARNNLYFYLRPAKDLMPSFEALRVSFTPPENYHACNPSVTQAGDRILLVQRCVNYRLDNGQYRTPENAPIRTRNFLLELADDLTVRRSREILEPVDLPPPEFGAALGFEDIRIFAWKGQLWTTSCFRQLTREGWCEQMLARVDDADDGTLRLTDWRRLQAAGPPRHEKNWIPVVDGAHLRFIYSSDPTRVLDEAAQDVAQSIPGIAADRFSGSSQAIRVDGGWLAVVHESARSPQHGGRFYQHRFVWYSNAFDLRKVSRPFFFQKKGIEFNAGLAWHPDGARLLLSYGVDDQESWLATVSAKEVRELLCNVRASAFVLPIAAASDAQRTDKPAAPGAAQPESRTSPPRPALRQAVPALEPSQEPAATLARRSTGDAFRALAPFLSIRNPRERRRASREFDCKIEPWLPPEKAVLPQIHSFYEVLSEGGRHDTLVASMRSMRQAGHPVTVWTYTPERLDFLRAHGVVLRSAADVVPRGLYEQIVAASEIRYFSDVFRYAVLYEHGGLWMDSDMVLLRPFPFTGEYFFNLQWSPGSRDEHFVCGNVIGAPARSVHLRRLYEMATARAFAPEGWLFGAGGPKLLSDYIVSDQGAELREWVFSPVLFNAVDWSEMELFHKPLVELEAHVGDERVCGFHLWTARNNPVEGEADTLLTRLLDCRSGFPSVSVVADSLATDRNRHSGNRHFYARVYDQILSPRRLGLRTIIEVGRARAAADGVPFWVPLWRTAFPYAEVVGVLPSDLSGLHREGFRSIACDPSNAADLDAAAARLSETPPDVIIEDGTHASAEQQLALKTLFPVLKPGGWYFIESLDWTLPGEDRASIAETKALLHGIRDHGAPHVPDPIGIGALAGSFAEILFFDSHYELARARLMGGLVAIRKR